jgi:hypothetical protein
MHQKIQTKTNSNKKTTAAHAVYNRGIEMAKIKYFYGDTELTAVWMDSKERFLSLGGVVSKHNYVSHTQNMIGYYKDDLENTVTVPVTRMIEYKSNPSKHKCDARCLHATGHVCECACGGKNHGAGNSLSIAA